LKKALTGRAHQEGQKLFLQKDIIIKKTMNSTGKVMTNVAANLPMTATNL
jgi:hypothetical protein